MTLTKLSGAVTQWRAWRDSPTAARKVSFGNHWVGRTLGAFRAGTMLVVGAQTNVGKTQFLLSLALAAKDAGILVSCEDGPEEVGRRAEGCPPAALERVSAAFPAYPRLETVVASIRDAHAAHGARIALVDYAQAVSVPGLSGNVSETMKVVCGELKGLARELEMVLVLASQLRRPAAGESEEPTLWRLRDGSSLENLADAVVLLSKVDADTLKAKVAKSKWTKVDGEQLYTRDPRTGWLDEKATTTATDEEF